MKKMKVLPLLLALALFAMGCGQAAAPAEEKKEEAPAEEAAAEEEAPAEEAAAEEEAPAAADGEVIKIGATLPLTGSVALNGEWILAGAQHAVDKCNAAGGINGKQVVIDAQDDQGEPNQSAAVANKFVADPAVLACIGCLKSSCTLAAAPIFNDGGLVTLSPDSSSPKVTDAGDWIFRIKDSDTMLAYGAVCSAADDGHTKLFICYENNDFGMGCLEQGQLAAEAKGIEIVGSESWLTGEQTDFSTIVANAKASEADAIFFGADYNESGLFMKQYREAGGEAEFYGTDGLFTDAVIQVGGDASEGLNALTSFHESDPAQAVQDFIKEWNEAYGENPTIFQAEGYDAAMILLEAIKNAGEDRTAIRDYMSTMKYQGVIGDCTFDENGDVHIPLKRVYVEGGTFKLNEKPLNID